MPLRSCECKAETRFELGREWARGRKADRSFSTAHESGIASETTPIFDPVATSTAATLSDHKQARNIET